MSTIDISASIRSFKDFLQIYNKMTEVCFSHCATTFGFRGTTDEEKTCVDLCAMKHVKVNHKIMKLYMEIQPEFINKKMREAEKLQQQAERNMESDSANDSI